jgi:hypothetical protein
MKRNAGVQLERSGFHRDAPGFRAAAIKSYLFTIVPQKYRQETR